MYISGQILLVLISLPFLSSHPTVLRVFRADRTPIPTYTRSGASSGASSPSGHPLDKKFSPYHLAPPAIEKNFLISPPGSPPVGWESLREEAPNHAPLADDLITALRKLQFPQPSGRPGSPSLSVLIEPEEGPGVGVYVEDCADEETPSTGSTDECAGHEEDVYEGERWYYAQPRARFVPLPTCRPPLPISV